MSRPGRRPTATRREASLYSRRGSGRFCFCSCFCVHASSSSQGRAVVNASSTGVFQGAVGMWDSFSVPRFPRPPAARPVLLQWECGRCQLHRRLPSALRGISTAGALRGVPARRGGGRQQLHRWLKTGGVLPLHTFVLGFHQLQVGKHPANLFCGFVYLYWLLWFVSICKILSLF